MPDYIPLSDEKVELLAEKFYGDADATRQDKPTIIFVAGQPGAGKSRASEVAKAELERSGGYVHIDADVLRLSIPNAKNFSATQSQPDCGRILAHLETLAIGGRRNIVQEGTLGKESDFLDRVNRLRETGYNIEVIGIAVSLEQSRFSVLKRREDLRDNGDYPRDVPHDYQESAYKGFTHNMTNNTATLERVRVVNRDGVALYDSANLAASPHKNVPEALENGRKLSDKQITELVGEWQKLHEYCETKDIPKEDMARLLEEKERFDAFVQNHNKAQTLAPRQAPRHDLNKNQAKMHVAATERIEANLEALKQNPALAKHPPEALEKLAYWHGIAQEAVKHEPPSAQDVALAKFDKAAEVPALLARLEKSDTQEQAKSNSKTRDRDDYGLER
ncbi:MAG: zeta toxin family protein [Candidatus Accumulibacter sp.]|jgi:hypothetical protein|nr:zeta toxin family protein [Accumulibacter sp.]